MALEKFPIQGSVEFAADTLLREGMIALGLVFCLGLMLIQMIESAHRRSEDALRETRRMNENLGSWSPNAPASSKRRAARPRRPRRRKANFSPT